MEVKRAVWLGLGKGGLPKGYLYLVSGLLSVSEADPQGFMKIALDGNQIMEILGVEPGRLVGELSNTWKM